MATNDNNGIILDNNTNQIAPDCWLLAVTGDFNFTEWGHYYRSRRHLFRYPTNNQQKRWWRKEGEQKIRAKRSQQSLASHNHAWIMISTTRRVAHYQHPPHFFFLFRFDFFLFLVVLFFVLFFREFDSLLTQHPKVPVTHANDDELRGTNLTEKRIRLSKLNVNIFGWINKWQIS